MSTSAPANNSVPPAPSSSSAAPPPADITPAKRAYEDCVADLRLNSGNDAPPRKKSKREAM
ncbi:hypothetical protein R3P38DRAFT_3239962 [Favolaschia claudopus]|uniref:Uncharacterized protein n=1 Tax=Favolaschia claudopus TaxID=2862362 RepID=A0AAV9Z6S7_9AGAR